MEEKNCFVCGIDLGNRALCCDKCWNKHAHPLFNKHYNKGLKPEKIRELIKQDLTIMIRKQKLEAI